MAISELFSRRRKLAQGGFPDVYQYTSIPHTFRVQITHIWGDTLNRGAYPDDVYFRMVQTLRREYGTYQLVADTYNPNNKSEANHELGKFFLNETDIERCLDVIEISLQYIDAVCRNPQYMGTYDVGNIADEAISEFNQRAKEHGVGYQYSDGELMRIDSELIHSEAVVPALVVMRDHRFRNAQSEFLKAHEHYRHGRMNEALVDALKSFESTMKIICDGRGWAYDASRGASELVRACLENGLIPSYWQNHFNGLKSVLVSAIPTPRNKQGGHGAGSAPAQIPPSELVSYVLHMTASTILFLSEADKKLP